MAELTTVARPYAKAAFAHARDKGQLGEWSAQLALAAALARDAEFAAYLSRPSMTVEQQIAAFIAAAGDALAEDGRNFVALLAQNKRIAALPDIAVIFEAMKAEAERTAQVEVTSAFEMTDDQKRMLSGQLAQRLGRTVSITATVDASLIGGAIIRTGDLVIDASLRGKLAKLSATLNS
jgi:F-type H+-transporting ATPase subunit delta